MKKHILLLVSIFCWLMSGCYYNSAGLIYAKSIYTATVNTGDAKEGSFIYQYLGQYYVELPSHRKEKKILTQYNWYEKVKGNMDKVEKFTDGPDPMDGRPMLFQISPELAMYLAGHDSVSTISFSVTPATEIENQVVKQFATKTPIVRTDSDISIDYQYKSSSAAGVYTLCTLDWLFVDVPVSAIQNAFAIPYYILSKMAFEISQMSLDKGFEKKMEENKHKMPCPYCGGDGMIDVQYNTYNTFGTMNGFNVVTESCRECRGTGKVWKEYY